MSARPDIPDAEKYRERPDLASECSHLILDLLSRDFTMRTEGTVGKLVLSGYSRVYEPQHEPAAHESLPAIRVRQEQLVRVDQQVAAGQFTADPTRDLHPYTLDFGYDRETIEAEGFDEIDNHTMYEWRPFVTAVIDMRRGEDSSDEPDHDEFEEVDCSIMYTEDGKPLDDIELMRLIALLQSVLSAAREYDVYEIDTLPRPTPLLPLRIGRLFTRNFGAFDALGMPAPCKSCIELDIPCAHRVSDS